MYKFRRTGNTLQVIMWASSTTFKISESLTRTHWQAWTAQSFTLLYVIQLAFTPSESHLYLHVWELLGIRLCTTHSYLSRHKLWWDLYHSNHHHAVQICCSWICPLAGHIAKLIGMPNYSRHVGQGEETFPHLSVWLFYQKSYGSALKFLPSNTNPPIPWHRVIGASGSISSRGPGTSGAQRQYDALQAEGVEVTTGRNGEMRVNLREFGWFPSISELNPVQNSDDDDNDVPETQPW